MRARSIKPGFFDNEELAEVEPLGRILFEGLWCLADREGRLEDRPKRIKMKVLPYDDCDVDALLVVLADRQFIIRYEHDELRFIQIVNFVKHQKPHHMELPSEIPAPAGYPQHTKLRLPDSLDDVDEQDEITPLAVNGRVVVEPLSNRARIEHGAISDDDESSTNRVRIEHEPTSIEIESIKSPNGPPEPGTRNPVTGTRNPETTAHERARGGRPVGEEASRRATKSGRFIDLVRAGGFEPNLLSRHHKLLNKDCQAPPELVAEAYLAAARGQWDPGGKNFLRDNLSVEAVVSRLDGYVAWKQGDKERAQPAAPPVRGRSNGVHVQDGPTDTDRSVAEFLAGRTVPARVASTAVANSAPEDFGSFKAPF